MDCLGREVLEWSPRLLFFLQARQLSWSPRSTLRLKSSAPVSQECLSAFSLLPIYPEKWLIAFPGQSCPVSTTSSPHRKWWRHFRLYRKWEVGEMAEKWLIAFLGQSCPVNTTSGPHRKWSRHFRLYRKWEVGLEVMTGNDTALPVLLPEVIWHHSKIMQ